MIDSLIVLPEDYWSIMEITIVVSSDDSRLVARDHVIRPHHDTHLTIVRIRGVPIPKYRDISSDDIIPITDDIGSS